MVRHLPSELKICFITGNGIRGNFHVNQRKGLSLSIPKYITNSLWHENLITHSFQCYPVIIDLEY